MPSKPKPSHEEIRQKIIGLGEKSFRKSYYPELRVRLGELERFRALLDQSNDAIFLTHAGSLRILDLNQASANLLGQDKNSLIGRELDGLLEFQPPSLLRSLLRGGTAATHAPRTEGVCFCQVADHDRCPVEFTAKEVAFAGGRYLVFVGRDISERQKAEAEKQELQRRLMQAQKMEAIGTLAGGIAHDFNNILAGIVGYAELGLDAARQGRATPDELHRIIEAADRAQELIRQILAFSRKADSRPRPMNMNKVMEETVALIERTIPKMIEVRLDLAPDLHPINGDHTQMEQVLLNLASNAADAMPGGGALTLETGNINLTEAYAATHLGLAGGDYVLITVSDTGQGMDPETLKHIFEPFYTTKELGKGTGLGLASVYGTVSSHGGAIICSSQPDGGTSFRIYLPALDAMTEEEAPPGQRAPAPLSGNERVLLVDDEEMLRDVGSHMLMRHGYQVETAGSGEEALEVFGPCGDGFDLVIMDLGMPGMGGFKCMQEMLRRAPRTKVLVASGYSGDVQQSDTAQAGAMGYVSKPFGISQLLTAVRGVLDGKGSG